MEICECGKQFEKASSLKSHARFCKSYVKKEKKQSIYKKEENLYECECGKQFEKSQSLNVHFSHCLIHRNGKEETRDCLRQGTMVGWNDFSDDKMKEIRKKLSKTYKNKIEKGEIFYPFQDKKHTKETLEKISLSYLNGDRKNHGYIRVKYYEVFCPFHDKIVKVQGTWELIYANYLNENNIRWTRNTKLRYRLFEDDYLHTYYPDFYLIDTDEYIEIKGYWWTSKDGKRDDKRKMEFVRKYNEDKKITVIMNIDKYKLNK